MTGDGSNSYVYDAENRLVSAAPASGGAASATLRYDPLGRLYETVGASTGTTRFLYDGDELVAEYNGSNTLLRRYLHGANVDDPVAYYEGASASTNRRWFNTNHQGSIVAVSGQFSTAVMAKNSYDEWGIPGGGNAGIAAGGRFSYTGQAWLPELGMYYYKARIYSATLGRFMQTDPVGYKDQVNLYGYVGNDPVNGRDPSGKDTCPDQVSICVNGPSDSGFKSHHDLWLLGESITKNLINESAKLAYKLAEESKNLMCRLPTIGGGAEASGYGGLGGGVTGEITFDPKTGQFTFTLGGKVGIGVGGGVSAKNGVASKSIGGTANGGSNNAGPSAGFGFYADGQAGSASMGAKYELAGTSSQGSSLTDIGERGSADLGGGGAGAKFAAGIYAEGGGTTPTLYDLDCAGEK